MLKKILVGLMFISLQNTLLNAYSDEYINKYRAKNLSKKSTQELQQEKKETQTYIQEATEEGEEACSKAPQKLNYATASGKEMQLFARCEAYSYGEVKKTLNYKKFHLQAIDIELKSRTKK